MLVAVGASLAKVAVMTLVAAAAAVLVIAGGASNVDSVKNARGGMSDMLDASRQSVNDAVVDDFNEPDGFWQRPDANERMSGQVFARGIAGGGRAAIETAKAGVLVAAPVQTTGFDLVEKSVVIQQYMESRLSPQAGGAESSASGPAEQTPPAEAAGEAPEAPAQPDTVCTFVGSDAGGMELECREVGPEGEQPPQDAQQPAPASSPDGTYYVRPSRDATKYVQSLNYITVDTTGQSGWTIEGYIANGPDPATGAGMDTEYSLSSAETPWWDDEQGLWRVTVMVSQDGREPEICEGFITRTGDLTITYDTGGFPVTLGGSRDG